MPVTVPAEGRPGAGKVVRMVVAVSMRQHFDGHAEITGGLPCISALLHQPGRGGMAERVGRHIRAKTRVPGGRRKPLPDRLDGLAVPLHAKVLPASFPAPYMAQKLGGKGMGGWRFFVSTRP